MILVLKPIYIPKIWGGTIVKKFGFNDAPSDTGEVYLVSCLDNYQSMIVNGRFKGQTLKKVFEKHPDIFFDKKYSVFPLLLKIIGAQTDLSVQVHPSDNYAQKHENQPNGKHESWYVLDCNENSTIVFGHNAKDKTDLTKLIANHNWNKLLNEIPLKPNMFFDVKPGTVHAIKANTLVYELQQTSDITYRLYDYDRKDKNNQLRPLHINKSIDMIYFPQKFKFKNYFNSDLSIKNKSILLIKNNCYQIHLINIKNEYEMIDPNNSLLITVITNKCFINNIFLAQGQTCLVTKDFKILISGTAKILVGKVT